MDGVGLTLMTNVSVEYTMGSSYWMGLIVISDLLADYIVVQSYSKAGDFFNIYILIWICRVPIVDNTIVKDWQGSVY